MMDKSIPYKDILMWCPAERMAARREPAAPAGFRFAPFAPGAGIDWWARVETSAGEFDREEEARERFAEQYGDDAEMLKKRLWFLLEENGAPAATASAWLAERDGRTVGMLHWVGVREDLQGRGLGRAIVQKALWELKNLHPGCEAVLHTQTWSWPAVLLYIDEGFEILKEAQFDHYVNRYAEAMPLLDGHIDDALLQRMRQHSI